MLLRQSVARCRRTKKIALHRFTICPRADQPSADDQLDEYRLEREFLLKPTPSSKPIETQVCRAGNQRNFLQSPLQRSQKLWCILRQTTTDAMAFLRRVLSPRRNPPPQKRFGLAVARTYHPFSSGGVCFGRTDWDRLPRFAYSGVHSLRQRPREGKSTP